MSPNTGPSLSELKVGVFVVVAGAVLLLAILSIGSYSGLLEERFTAVTYLSNVSGLKRSNIVLLGGVEVGNVSDVMIIEQPGQFPTTDQNSRTRARIQQLEIRRELLESQIADTEANLEEARRRLQAAIDSGTDPSRRRSLDQRVNALTANSASQTTSLEQLQDDIGREARGYQNIRIMMQIRTTYRDWIRRDSGISLGTTGLLGDKNIEISLGRTPDPPQMDRIDDEEVVVITGIQQAGFQELITGTNDILATFSSLSSTVDDIMNKVEVGGGTIGRILNDPSIYESLRGAVESADRTMDQAAEVMEQLARGDGTIPSLIRQREVYDNIIAATVQLQSVVDRIDAGEGTLGKLVNDSSIYDRADQVVANIESITAKMDSGQGTLGKLSTDDELYVNLQGSLDQLKRILQSIEAGEGTLGRLAKDEELYNNINELSSEMVKLLYDFRQDPKKFLTIKFELF